MTRLLCLAAFTLTFSPVWAGDAQEVPGSPPPPSAQALDEAITRGVNFLLEVQNKDGSWGSARNTKNLNIYSPVPGGHHAFRSAVTALCLSALIELDSDREEVTRAIQRGEEWLMKWLPRLRRATPDALYNVWGHGYGIQTLVRMYHRLPDDADRRQKIRTLIEQQVDLLGRYESVNGGWGYYDFDVGSQKPTSISTCFMSAMVLVAFHEAGEIGIQAPEKLVRRAIASIHRQQKGNFTYLYNEQFKIAPMALINRPGGSLGRSQACNVALRLWGDEKITDQVIQTWLTRLAVRNGWLDMGRKRPIPHESWFQVAGYFFYFGHYYAGLCIDQLPEENRAKYQDPLAALLLPLQEKDGSWWDYPLYDYHQQYGTAYCLMTLLRCRH